MKLFLRHCATQYKIAASTDKNIKTYTIESYLIPSCSTTSLSQRVAKHPSKGSSCSQPVDCKNWITLKQDKLTTKSWIRAVKSLGNSNCHSRNQPNKNWEWPHNWVGPLTIPHHCWNYVGDITSLLIHIEQLWMLSHPNLTQFTSEWCKSKFII